MYGFFYSLKPNSISDIFLLPVKVEWSIIYLSKWQGIMDVLTIGAASRIIIWFFLICAIQILTSLDRFLNGLYLFYCEEILALRFFKCFWRDDLLFQDFSRDNTVLFVFTENIKQQKLISVKIEYTTNHWRHTFSPFTKILL